MVLGLLNFFRYLHGVLTKFLFYVLKFIVPRKFGAKKTCEDILPKYDLVYKVSSYLETTWHHTASPLENNKFYYDLLLI